MSGENPLEGLSCIEVGHTVAVSMAAGMLADLGAEVFLLERGSGCAQRALDGFTVWSRLKKCASVDNLAAYPSIAASFDVVVADRAEWESCGRPTGRLGAVVVEPDGVPDPLVPELSSEAATLLAEAYSGLGSQQSTHRGGPAYLVEQPSSFGCAALAAAAALILALRGSQDVAHVSHVDGSVVLQLFSTVVPTEEPVAAPQVSSWRDVQSVGGPTIRFVQATDGWIFICAATPARWVSLMAILGLGDLLADPAFDGAPLAIADEAAKQRMVRAIESSVTSWKVNDLVSELRSAGIVCGLVCPPDAALADPQIEAIGMAERYATTDGVEALRPGIPIVVNGTRNECTQAPPEVGQHTATLFSRPTCEVFPRGPARAETSAELPPLAGLRVLDMSTFAAGPGISRLLCGLGAEVIKIEASEGDPFRNLAFSFQGVNAGKRTTRMHIKTGEDRELLYSLIERADVVVHNLTLARAQEMAIEEPVLQRINPAVVRCVISGYGQVGPDADIASVDGAVEARVGGALIRGGGDEPIGYAGALTDNGAAALGLVAILAGLLARRRAPAPKLEVSLLATCAYRLAGVLSKAPGKWRELPLAVDPVGTSACCRLYRCSDAAWIALAIEYQCQWDELTSILPDLPARFDPGRTTWLALVEQILTDQIQERPSPYWLATLREHGVPCAIAQRYEDYVRSVHGRGEARVAGFQDPRWGELIGVSELIRFDDAAWVRPATWVELPKQEIAWKPR